MTVLLIVTLICAVLLAITGSLSPWVSGLIVIAVLAELVIKTYGNLQQQRQIRQQCQRLQAAWGISVRHLGGLPMPLETPASLFLLPDQLLLIAEHDQLAIPLDETNEILLTTADQIRKISDKQLCSLLASTSSRTFSALREKTRHRDSGLHRNGILMLVYQADGNEPGLLILAVNRRPDYLADLLRHPALADRVKIRLLLGQTSDTMV